jgi:hypothetical protein
VNQAAPFPVRGPSEFPNSDSNYEGDGTYLFYALVADEAHHYPVILDPGGK